MQRYSGWCMVAYYHMSYEEMKTEVQKQIKHGSNYLWIGHNNPGVVDKDAPECALFYGVYEAFVDKNHPKHEDAVEILDSQLRLLDVCRELGVKITLPIGYQIMMGESWNEKNKSELRLDIQGNAVWHGGYPASFHSNIYKKDIVEYYQWINDNIVKKYSDVIHLINLSDEPKAEDFSPCAEKAFIEEYGLSFTEALCDSQGQLKLAKFQADYIANYAKWSAEQWLIINTDIKTTMTFCGYGGKEDAIFPTIEEVFRETPDNFSVTFDMYPRDGWYDHYLSEEDITALYVCTRQLGYLSQKYSKSLWFWSTANSWGLSQDSPVKSGIGDALANQYYLAVLAADCTDYLEGICVWNYNIKGQGLYNDTRNTSYDIDEMFFKVSKTFVELREIMEKSSNSDCDVLLYSPVCERYRNCIVNLINPVQRVVINIPYDYILPVRYKRQEALAKDDVKFTVVDDLEGININNVKVIISETSTDGLVWKDDMKAISEFVKNGGLYVTGVNVSPADRMLNQYETMEFEIKGVNAKDKYSRVIFQVEGLAGQEMYVYGEENIVLDELDSDVLIIAANENGEPVIALKNIGEGNFCYIAPDRRKIETIINRNVYKMFIEWLLERAGVRFIANNGYAASCSECALIYSLNPIRSFVGVNTSKELNLGKSYSVKRDGSINADRFDGLMKTEKDDLMLMPQKTGDMALLWWDKVYEKTIIGQVEK